MATSIAPRADQPKVSTESLKRSATPSLQYKNTGVKSYNRGARKDYGGRPTRG
jgi:hypothetical protein